MKFSLNWLNSYIGGTPLEAEATQEALTQLGFEVEAVVHKGLAASPYIVVGRVLKRDPHPNADRLSVCEVDVGPGQAHRTIVCGAQNYGVGDCVPAALPGAVLPGNFVIKESTLRGVGSQGMLCSARELGLGDDAGGLMILKNPPAEGTPVHSFLGEADTVFDLEITPNRPDCLSYIGLARELCAHFKREQKGQAGQLSGGEGGLTHHVPESTLRVMRSEAPRTCASLPLLQNEVRCSLYTAYTLETLQSKESPAWLKERLESVGLKAINVIVDVTNFVLQETGQPMHAFDAKKLVGNILTVRAAHPGEVLETLDGQTRTLQADDLVIADGQGPVALAGILGGSRACVDADTTDVVLEVAHFSKRGIRASARRLEISTESSHRFERGVDPHGLQAAADRALELLTSLAGGTVTGIAQAGALPEASAAPALELSAAFVQKHCGFKIPTQAIESSLQALGFTLTPQGLEAWSVKVPTYRQNDVLRPIDLVEEVLRLYGTHNIPKTPLLLPKILQTEPAEVSLEKILRNHLVANGFFECMNDSFVSKADLLLTETPAEAIAQAALNHPINQEQTHLRPHLLYGLLKNFKTNLDHGNSCKGFFELGHAFVAEPEGLKEVFSLGFIWVKSPLAQHWQPPAEVDFFAARELMEQLLSLFQKNLHTWTPEGDPSHPLSALKALWHPGHRAAVTSSCGQLSAQVGLLSPTVLKEKGVKGWAFAGQLWYAHGPNSKPQKRPQFQKPSSFPCVSKDLSLVVPKTVPAQHVANTLCALFEKELAKDPQFLKNPFKLEALRLFDVYTGPGVPAGHKSLSFALAFRSDTGTLNDATVQPVFEALIGKNPYPVRS